MLKLLKSISSPLYSETLLENAQKVSYLQSRLKSNKPCSSKSGKGGSSKGDKKEKKEKKSSKGKEKDKEESGGSQCQCNDGKGKDGGSEVPKIGINGFGRIGRTVMRVAFEHSCPLEIVAVNDPFLTPEYMAYMLKYDSTHGRFIGDIEVDGNQLIVDGKSICTYKEADPKNIPWKDLDVDYVVEATGKHTTTKKAEAHIGAGAKKVVITAASEDAPIYVVGVNLECYDPACKVVSNASCATHGCAPFAKVVHDKFEIEEAIMTTVHAVTPSQKILDSINTSGKKWRDGRSGMQNIIPSSTGAAKALVKVIPELEGKITAVSIRVPVPNVSLIDLYCRLKKEASLDDIRCALCEASEGPLMGILGVTNEEVVSQDFNGSHYSCVYDHKASLALNKNFVKLLAWFDNEYGYSCRVIDLIKFMHAEQQAQS